MKRTHALLSALFSLGALVGCSTESSAESDALPPPSGAEIAPQILHGDGAFCPTSCSVGTGTVGCTVDCDGATRCAVCQGNHLESFSCECYSISPHES